MSYAHAYAHAPANLLLGGNKLYGGRACVPRLLSSELHRLPSWNPRLPFTLTRAFAKGQYDVELLRYDKLYSGAWIAAVCGGLGHAFRTAFAAPFFTGNSSQHTADYAAPLGGSYS